MEVENARSGLDVTDDLHFPVVPLSRNSADLAAEIGVFEPGQFREGGAPKRTSPMTRPARVTRDAIGTYPRRLRLASP